MMKRKTAAPERVPPPLEALLVALGVDLAPARSRLKQLAAVFPSGIPEATLRRWIEEHYLAVNTYPLLVQLARAWEKER